MKKVIPTVLADRSNTELIEKVFLGVWANQKNYEENNDVEYIHHKLNALHSFHESCKTIFNDTIDDVAGQLLTFQEISSKNFWKQLISQWYYYYVCVMLERWLIVENQISQDDEVIVDYFQELNHIRVDDLNMTLRLFSSDIWNQSVFQEIYLYKSKYDQNINIQYVYGNHQKFSAQVLNSRKRWRDTIYELCTSIIFHRTMRNKDILWVGKGFTGKNRYFGKDGEILFLRNLKFIKDKVKINDFKRGLSFKLDGDENSFKDFLAGRLISDIPRIFTGDFKEFFKYMSKMHTPKVFATICNITNDDGCNLFSAYFRQVGTKIVLGQHGGHYGIGSFDGSFDIDMHTCDVYLAWGWGKDTGKVINSPSVSLSRYNKHFRKANHATKDRISVLLVQNSWPRLANRFVSGPVSSRMTRQYALNDLLINQLNKVDTVDLKVRQCEDFGRGYNQKVKIAKNIQVDKNKDILRSLLSHDIVVVTSNTTTLLEILIMNKPFILILDEELWGYSERGQWAIELLRSVEIYHSSAETAVKTIEKHQFSLCKWWQSEKLQSIILELQQQFCGISQDAEMDLKLLLSKLKKS